MQKHHYKIKNTWTGNFGLGTKDYKSYERLYSIQIEGKPDIEGTSDPSFRGDKTKHNPEELFIASISGCHMLWYLHLCSTSGVVVLSYEDETSGIMTEEKDGSGAFKEVTLNPKVVVQDISMIEKAKQLHEKANKMCFIANSCNFPIKHIANIMIKPF